MGAIDSLGTMKHDASALVAIATGTYAYGTECERAADSFRSGTVERGIPAGD